MEAVLDQRACSLGGQAIATPSVGRELEAQNRCSLQLSGLAETGDAAQPPQWLIEDADLVVLAWLVLLPGDEKIEVIVNPAPVGFVKVAEAQVAWVPLVRDEGRPVALDEITQKETRRGQAHGPPYLSTHGMRQSNRPSHRQRKRVQVHMTSRSFSDFDSRAHDMPEPCDGGPAPHGRRAGVFRRRPTGR